MTHYHHFIKIILQQTITFILTRLDLHQICISIAPSAEYGRTQRDLARARPFLGPYFLYIIKKTRVCTCHTLQTGQLQQNKLWKMCGKIYQLI